jgi:hypothetical protein
VCEGEIGWKIRYSERQCGEINENTKEKREKETNRKNRRRGKVKVREIKREEERIYPSFLRESSVTIYSKLEPSIQ